MPHRRTAPTKDTGAAIEAAAAAWLERYGLTCIARNFRCRCGEIDLIMHDRDTLVFVEVRLRSRNDFGSAAESVTATKQRRVVRAAQYFLTTHERLGDAACRFDVLAATRENRTIVWEWVRDAFYAG